MEKNEKVVHSLLFLSEDHLHSASNNVAKWRSKIQDHVVCYTTEASDIEVDGKHGYLFEIRRRYGACSDYQVSATTQTDNLLAI